MHAAVGRGGDQEVCAGAGAAEPSAAGLRAAGLRGAKPTAPGSPFVNGSTQPEAEPEAVSGDVPEVAPDVVPDVVPDPGEPEAVVFDYYGTLTVATSAATRRAGSERVAARLGVPVEAYFEVLLSTFTERSTGACGDLRSTMEWVARRCGHVPSEAQLDAACHERRVVEGAYAGMVRHDAVTTLRSLRRRGLRIGVVSDCTHELPELWDGLPVARWVDAAVFSVVIGRRKPHPSLYRAVCEQLGVDTRRVLYVGDGGSNELTGARSVGMTAVRLTAADAEEALVYDAEREWTGPVISRLGALDLLPLSRWSERPSQRVGPASSGPGGDRDD